MAFLTGHKRRRDWLIAVLAVLALAFLMLGYAQNRRVSALATALDANDQKAVFESAELVSGALLNLEKLMVSASPAHEQTLLQDAARQAGGAAENLAALPEGNETLEGALKFVNQAADLCASLARKLARGDSLDVADRKNLDALREGCAELTRILAQTLVDLENGTLTLRSDSGEIRDVSRKIGDTQTPPLVDYPALLYDGPFSDGGAAERLAAPGAQIDAEAARRVIYDYIGAERAQEVRFAGESNILGGTYDFEVRTDSGLLYASVVRAGGQVLYLLPDGGAKQALRSQGECIDLAARFLSQRGYGDMSVSYWRAQDNLLTVNFAAVQDGVLLYPDLVKVQVSMEDGQIVGVDAGNYLRNHRPRTLETPRLTEEQVVLQLNSALTIEGVRRCVIPIGSGEAECFEVFASIKDGASYLIYFDTQTGEERNILQLVEDEEGILAQ